MNDPQTVYFVSSNRTLSEPLSFSELVGWLHSGKLSAGMTVIESTDGKPARHGPAEDIFPQLRNAEQPPEPDPVVRQDVYEEPHFTRAGTIWAGASLFTAATASTQHNTGAAGFFGTLLISLTASYLFGAIAALLLKPLSKRPYRRLTTLCAAIIACLGSCSTLVRSSP